jgi:hypothetical protein
MFVYLKSGVSQSIIIYTIPCETAKNSAFLHLTCCVFHVLPTKCSAFSPKQQKQTRLYRPNEDVVSRELKNQYFNKIQVNLGFRVVKYVHYYIRIQPCTELYNDCNYNETK